MWTIFVCFISTVPFECHNIILYLVFAIGNVIYVGLELGYHLAGDVPNNCKTTFGWIFILRLIFIIIQSFFIFKNPKVCGYITDVSMVSFLR